jgi:hypothetical protein
MHSHRDIFFGLSWKILILFLGLSISLSSSWSCNRKIRVGNFDTSMALSYVYFAHPEGGIRAYSSKNNEVVSISDALDYHPTMLKSGLLYFLRYQKADQTGKFTQAVSLMSWNSQDFKIKKITTLTSLPFKPELTNQVFILEEGKKLLLLNHSKGKLLIHLESDTTLSFAGNEKYLTEINYNRNEGQELFANLFQYPYQNVIKTKNAIEAPPPQSAILSIDQNFSIKIWDEIPPEDMFNSYYHGIAFDQNSKLLFLSKDGKLYAYSEAGMTGTPISEGVHPFVIHESSRRETASFPLLAANILWKKDSYVFLGSESYLSYFDLKKGNYIAFQSKDFNLSPKDTENSQYLFHRLTFLAQSTQLPSSYWLVSVSKESIKENNEESVLEKDQIDALVFFSISDQGPAGIWQSSGQMYPEIWLEDLNKDGQVEILNYYCLSSFNCPGETLLNGRYLVWLDIFGKTPEGFYERKNDSYPSLYRELWERLALVKKEQEAFSRNQQDYLCDEDLQTLNNMLEESHRIASQ